MSAVGKPVSHACVKKIESRNKKLTRSRSKGQINSSRFLSLYRKGPGQRLYLREVARFKEVSSELVLEFVEVLTEVNEY